MGVNEFEDFNLDSFDFGDFDSLDTGVNIQSQPVATPDVSNIVTSLKKRAMVVFFVIDISGSMEGARIGAVNDAIRNVIPELKKKERGNTAAEIRIAILKFSTTARWLKTSPEPISTFEYTDIKEVGGGTNYGMAFHELNEKLSEKHFLSSTAGSYTPLIIFMTDGKPSDPGLYKEKLVDLKNNKWFKHSTRAGIAIEEGALSAECKRVLLEFTENEKNVYEAKNTVVLAKQIELVTLTGVDFVTQQGSIQNPSSSVNSEVQASRNPNTVQNSATSHNMNNAQIDFTVTQNSHQNSNSISSQSQSGCASPTLPIEDIDWENDFNF